MSKRDLQLLTRRVDIGFKSVVGRSTVADLLLPRVVLLLRNRPCSDSQCAKLLHSHTQCIHSSTRAILTYYLTTYYLTTYYLDRPHKSKMPTRHI
jgi:hypothetical protein